MYVQYWQREIINGILIFEILYELVYNWFGKGLINRERERYHRIIYRTRKKGFEFETIKLITWKWSNIGMSNCHLQPSVECICHNEKAVKCEMSGGNEYFTYILYGVTKLLVSWKQVHFKWSVGVNHTQFPHNHKWSCIYETHSFVGEE